MTNALRALVAVLTVGFTQHAFAADTISLRYGFVATGINAFWAYGKAQGIFEKEGIDLELREGKGSAVTAQTVANGTDDFGCDVDGGTFISLAAQGLPAVAVLAQTEKALLAIVSSEKSPIKVPHDVVGKQIGVTLGGSSGSLFPLLLKRNDIPSDQVTTVNLQPGALLTTLLAGRLDGVATFATVAGALRQKGLPVHAMMFADNKVATPPPFVIVSKSLLDRNPQLVARFVSAARRSLMAAMGSPDAAIAAFVKLYPSYNAETAAAEQRIFFELGWPSAKSESNLGSISIDSLRAQTEVLVQAGSVPAGTDPTKYVASSAVMK